MVKQDVAIKQRYKKQLSSKYRGVETARRSPAYLLQADDGTQANHYESCQPKHSRFGNQPRELRFISGEPQDAGCGIVACNLFGTQPGTKRCQTCRFPCLLELSESPLPEGFVAVFV